MILAVMVGFLINQVYRVIRPPDDTAGQSGPPPRPPSPTLSADAVVPGIPPPAPPNPLAQDYSSLIRKNPFLYIPAGSAQNDTDKDDEELELTLLRIVDPGNGKYRAQIKSPASTRWYEEGEKFESFEVTKINFEEECCQVYSTSQSRSVEICKE